MGTPLDHYHATPSDNTAAYQTSSSPRFFPSQGFLSIRCDNFAAQALCAWLPHLRDRMFVVVNQQPQLHKTVAIACSWRALQQGITPGTAVVIIKSKHPACSFEHRQKQIEDTVSRELYERLYRFTPDIITHRPGHFTLDLRGRPRHDHYQLAQKIQHDLQIHTTLPGVHFGLGPTKAVARMLCAQNKSDTIAVCPTHQLSDFIRTIAIRHIPDLSSTTRAKLQRYNITTLGGLAQLGKPRILQHFGAEGEKLYAYLFGEDLLLQQSFKKQFSVQTTLNQDIISQDILLYKVRYTVDLLCHHLRKSQLCAKKVRLCIVYSDNKKAQRTLAFTTQTQAYTTLCRTCCNAFIQLHQRRVAIRAIRLSVPLYGAETLQTELFCSAASHRQHALAQAIDTVRQKNRSFDAIHSATALYPQQQ